MYELLGVYVGGCLELLQFPLMREMKKGRFLKKDTAVVNIMIAFLINCAM